MKTCGRCVCNPVGEVRKRAVLLESFLIHHMQLGSEEGSDVNKQVLSPEHVADEINALVRRCVLDQRADLREGLVGGGEANPLRRTKSRVEEKRVDGMR